MSEVEIGRGKRGRTAYSFDDIAIVPSRRTRDPEEVSVSTSSNATGTFNRYAFHIGSNFFDYEKISVWPDGCT